MNTRNRFKVEKIGGDYCDFEESTLVNDAFELLDPADYPADQRAIVDEFNRRAEIGNQRHRIAMYRAEMFEKGFNAGMYICTFDHDENMTSFVFTDETRRMLGYDGLEDLPNEFDSWVKTLLPDQREAMVPIFWSTVKQHRQLPDISHAEYPMIRKDGKVIWVTGAGRFIRRADGTLEIYMGCYRDVTAEHVKDDYLHIIEGIGKIFNFSLYIDMASGTYQVISTNEFVENTKKDPNAFQFLRDNVDFSVHPDFRHEMNEWFQSSRISTLLQEKDIVSKDFRSLAEDRWFRATFMVGDRNENGSLRHIIYGCEEITDSKRIELEHKAKLEESLNITRSIVGTYHSVYYLNLEDGSFTEQSQVADHVENVIGRRGNTAKAMADMCKYLVAPEQTEMMRSFVDVATLQERLQNQKWISRKYLGASGKWSEGFFIAAERDAEGNCTRALWVIRDIDNEKKKELEYQEKLANAKVAAEAANAAKTSFLFNMSHDIRTPMNAIMGFRDLLEKHQNNPVRRQDYLNKIKDASTVLLSIINNVLEMARIEKGTLEINETAWSTEQFNDTLYSVFHMMMEEKGLKFTRQIEVQHHYVYCDPTKLREIFLNILSNAYKYTNAGGSVNMHLEEVPSSREGWVLYRTTISDTGIGMSEDFLPHIFEEFSRENNTTDAKVEGTGLGMPIVKRLVDMLDGTIEVKSKKGEGSTFTVTIPHRIADKTNLVEHAGIEIDPKLFKDKHILLAEDNDLNAEIAMEILGEAGFIIDRAEDGAICIDMLKAAKEGYYDLILMDIQMPNLNGYEATKVIRQLDDSQKANIKIIAMTANAFEEDKRNALASGMNGHIAKPINVNELMKTLAAII